MARVRKLKVFEAQIGFYDTVVAAPSQAAALRAWGTHQNLFADGQARLATDEAAVEAALAHPEVLLRRAVGSTDAFALTPTGLPKVPAPANAKGKARAKSKREPRKPEPPPVDRSKLDAAEAELLRLDEERKTEEAALQREVDALQVKRAQAQAAYVAARKKAAAAVASALSAYRKAGGR